MKVLFLIDSLGSGGAQNQVVQIAKELFFRKINVFVVYYHNILFFAPFLDKHGISHFFIDKSKLGFVRFIFVLKKFLIQNEITHVISFLDGPNFYATLMKVFLPNIKVIISERSRTPLLSKYRLRYWQKKFSFFMSYKIMTNSYHEKENLIYQFSLGEDKIFVFYNLIDLNRFHPKYIINNKKLHLLAIGSVSPMKNGICLIEALKLFNQSNSISLKVDWYGEKVSTIKERADYYHEMVNLIKNYNLEDNWNWLEPTEKIHKVYGQYDCLIHSSTTEGLPNVICEALASGVPVIASNVLDHPILVSKGRGFLFDPGNPESLKCKLEKFYKLNQEEKDFMKENARLFAQKMFSKKNIKHIEILCGK